LADLSVGLTPKVKRSTSRSLGAESAVLGVACAALSEGAGGGERRGLGEVRYLVIERDAGDECLAGATPVFSNRLLMWPWAV
jgi:hypothetical protein